jgi:hypothetical protein
MIIHSDPVFFPNPFMQTLDDVHNERVIHKPCRELHVIANNQAGHSQEVGDKCEKPFINAEDIPTVKPVVGNPRSNAGIAGKQGLKKFCLFLGCYIIKLAL